MSRRLFALTLPLLSLLIGACAPTKAASAEDVQALCVAAIQEAAGRPGDLSFSGTQAPQLAGQEWVWTTEIRSTPQGGDAAVSRLARCTVDQAEGARAVVELSSGLKPAQPGGAQ